MSFDRERKESPLETRANTRRDLWEGECKTPLPTPPTLEFKNTNLGQINYSNHAGLILQTYRKPRV